MINTSLCYLEENGKYLMIHRTKKENDQNKDKWLGIGGKFEHGETPFDCVKREFYEETGLQLGPLKYRGIITFVLGNTTEYMHLFTANEYSGQINSDSDEGELCWIDKKQLLDMPIWEGDKIFLKLIETNQDFFSLKLVYDNDVLIDSVLEF